MDTIDGKDLTPAFFAHVAAQLATFAADERERLAYVALRRARSGLTLRGTWLTDRGLKAAARLAAKQ